MTPDTPPPRSAAERGPRTAALEPHDGGCRCWPHVSQRDAYAAVEAVALAEYRDGLRRAEATAAVPLDAMTAERDALAEDYEALAATPAHVLDVLILSWAIDEHAQAVPPEEPVHDGGTCSDDCAGDIRARYARLSADEEGER